MKLLTFNQKKMGQYHPGELALEAHMDEYLTLNQGVDEFESLREYKCRINSIGRVSSLHGESLEFESLILYQTESQV